MIGLTGRLLFSVGGSFMLLVFIIIGMSAGIAADSPEDLDISEQIDWDSIESPEEQEVASMEIESGRIGLNGLPLDKTTDSALSAEQENAASKWITKGAVEFMKQGVEFVSEPAAHFVYMNQWVPLSVWKGMVNFAAIIIIIYPFYRLVKNSPFY